MSDVGTVFSTPEWFSKWAGREHAAHETRATAAAALSVRLLVLLALVAVLPYLNALTAGFTLDDEPDILNNSAVTAGVDIIGILASPLFPGDLYRPFTVLTFAANQRLSPGAAAPFHAVNIVMHAGVTLLVAVLALQLFQTVRLAVVAAVLFAVHPIHTEAVTSLVGRAELLAALFGLLALVTGVDMDGGRRGMSGVALRVLSVCSFSLALLSKESALTLLLLVPLFRTACRGESFGHGLWNELRSLDWVPYALCAGAFVALRYSVIGAVAPPDQVTPLDNVLAFVPWTVRIRSALGVLWDYFGLLNVPLILAADYSYNQVAVMTSWIGLRFLAGLALLIGAVLVRVRTRDQGLGFAILFPLLALAVTANVLFPIGTVKAERLLYLPSVGWALVLALGFDRLLERPRYRPLAAGVLSLVVVLFGARTWSRNRDWRDNLTLYRSMVRTAPESAKARYNFGVALRQDGDDVAAIAQFKRALAIYPAEGAALGIGVILEKQGRIDGAVQWYEKALEIRPAYDSAHTNLCHVLYANGRFAAAGAACRCGLRYDPADANLLKGLGGSLVATGATAKGIEVLRRSLLLNQNDEELRAYIAQLEAGAGDGTARDAEQVVSQ